MSETIAELMQDTLNTSNTLFIVLKHADYYQKKLTNNNNLLKSVMVIGEYGIACEMEHSFNKTKLTLRSTVDWKFDEYGIIDSDKLFIKLQHVHKAITTEIDRLRK